MYLVLFACLVSGRRSHCNDCMNVDGCMSVAWGLYWGGCRGTKACAFPYKAAAAGD